jgi:energy-converting hydrogenase Eha subunit A
MIVVVFFLMAMAVLAGVGIGVVIGLALGMREDSNGRSSTEPDARLLAPGVLPVREAASAPPVQKTTPARTSWSVALAIGVIVICCLCTFLLAALVTIAR